MRPLGPLPLSRDRSTPSSRANLRTDGDACAALKACASTEASAFAAGASTAGARGGAGVGAAADGGGALPFALDGAGCGEGAAPAAAIVAITVPSLTRSPTETRTPWIAPATGDGTSIVALSDSSVTSGSSILTMSPGFTKSSMTGMSLKSPMSGTRTSTLAPSGGVAVGPSPGVSARPASPRGARSASGGEGAAGAVAALLGAGAGAAAAGCGFAPSVLSRVRISEASFTLSQTLTLSIFTTPADGEGTSIVALSDSSVTSESSAFTLSPAFTSTSMTGTSSKSPMSGTLTSIVLTKLP